MTFKQEHQQWQANQDVRNALRRRIARAGFDLGYYRSEEEGWIRTEDYTMRELWEISRDLDDQD